MARTNGNGLGLNPDFQRILGSTLIKALTSADPKTAPLIIGNQPFSKLFLTTEMKIANFGACRNVSRACRELGITTVEEFLNTPPHHFALIENCGEYACYVVLRIREWKHRALGWDADVQFRSLKTRHQREEERKEAEKKQARRKNTRSRELGKAADQLLAGQ